MKPEKWFELRPMHGRLRKASGETAEALAAVRTANGQLEAWVHERMAGLTRTNGPLREARNG